ncbi:MAG: MgtC/SapB family protein [Armatimonadetes bacterium]|nr:MgtC/SapB family protein [Armatimonadota bacterium]
MSWNELPWMIGKLVLALLLGGLVGLERERHDRPAGLRTNMLVCMGAALITMVSVQVAGTRNDPGRIAAQIVSGIGFLGAGTILRQGNVIRGLTTAAGLWVVAGIGMAVAAGGPVMVVAIFGTLLAVVTLLVMSRVEHRLIHRRHVHTLVVRVRGGQVAIGGVLTVLSEMGVDVRATSPVERSAEGVAQVRLRLSVTPGRSEEEILQDLQSRPEVEEAYWE